MDSDYRGELGVVLYNHSEEDFKVNEEDRVVQLILERIKTPVVQKVQPLDPTDGGAGGFGSIGMQSKGQSELGKKGKTKKKETQSSELRTQ